MDRRNDRVDVLSRVDLAALLEELAAPRDLYARRRRYPCPSTAHRQTGRTPPVTIRTAAEGYDLWHCHSCGAGGSAVDALLAAGDARDVAEAFVRLRGDRFGHPVRVAQRSGGARRPPVRRSPTQAALSPERLAQARRTLTRFVEHCHRRLATPEADEARRWLHARGLTDAEIAAHGIGYDPGYHRLGRPPETLPAPATPAVFLPLLDEAGEVAYAQARPLDERDDGPKFLNPYSDWIGPSPRVSAIRSPKTADRSVVVVTEGLCDGIIAGRYFEARAIIGAGQPDDAVADRLVKVAAGRPLIVCFDSDKAGRDGAKTLLEHIAERGGRGDSVTLPAKDLTAALLEMRERFEDTFRELVTAAAERVGSERARVRGSPSADQSNDPLDRCRHLLGLRRTERLEAHLDARVDDMAQHDLAWLEARRDELRDPFETLDRAGALETLRLERRRSVVATRVAAYRNSVGQDKQLTRTSLKLIEADEAELAQLDEDERTLRIKGHHLDSWLEPKLDEVEDWIAVRQAISARVALDHRLEQAEEPSIEAAVFEAEM